MQDIEITNTNDFSRYPYSYPYSVDVFGLIYFVLKMNSDESFDNKEVPKISDERPDEMISHTVLG